MYGTHPESSTQPSPAQVLTRALLRAAEILAMPQKDLANVLGVSPASLSRLSKGSRPVAPQSKEGELAILFLRVFRGLDALVGGSKDKSQGWFHAENVHFKGVQAQLVQTVPGLAHVSVYLNAMRYIFEPSNTKPQA